MFVYVFVNLLIKKEKTKKESIVFVRVNEETYKMYYKSNLENFLFPSI